MLQRPRKTPNISIPNLFCHNSSRTGPATSNIDPLSQAAALLALHIDNVRVAAAAAADAVLGRLIVLVPVLVLLAALALVGCRLL